MDLGLNGKGAVVGGASRGLGRAIAEGLAAEGCRLVIWSRGGSALDGTADDIRGRFGAEVHTVAADAGSPDSAVTVARAAIEALGAVDVLVLNAGGPPTADPTRTEPEAWGAAFRLLAETPIALATELLPAMRARRWGRIVAVLASAIRQPTPELVYSASGRSALAAWMKATSGVVARDGITINGVVPGRFDTARVASLNRERAEREGRDPDEVRRTDQAMIPAGRYGRPEELASLVIYLCSDPAAYQTGTLVAVDGGMIQAL